MSKLKFFFAYIIFSAFRLSQLRDGESRAFAFDRAYRDACAALRFLGGYGYPENPA